MANDGVITGQEVLRGVKEEIALSHEALKKLLATYNELAKAAQKFNTVQGGNKVAKETLLLKEKEVKLLTQMAGLKKKEADAERAVTNAKKAELAVIQKKEQAERRSIKTTNTNVGQLKSLNSMYLQQSRLLNSLRDRYKSLEIKKQLGIALTKKEAVEYAALRVKVLSLNAALTRTDAAAGQFQRNVGNYPKALTNLAGAARSLAGAFGFTSGIFLFASAIKDSFNRVREFDKSMQNLAGVLGETRKQIAPIEREVIRVAGASVKTSREVGALSESLATLGKRGQDLIDLIEPANDLSIALQATSDDAAEFLVQTLNAFQEPSSSAKEFANTITAIRTSTSLDFEKMRDSFQYITPIAKLLNKDLAYTGAVVGLLADNGLKAESAGRLLGTALQKIAKEGRTLDSALQEINTAIAQGKTEYELLALASEIFGKQAAKIGIIMASNIDTLEKSSIAIRENGTALNDLVNEQLNSLDAKIKILDSTWEQLILTIENGNGSISTFFSGAISGVTGYLLELTKVEAAQGRVFELTGANKGFLDYLQNVIPFISGITSEYEGLVEKQREFNEYLDNIDSSTSLGFLEDEIASLNDEIENNNDLTEDQIKLYKNQRDRVQELYDSNVDLREGLKEEAREIINVTGKFEEFGAKLDVLSNKQIQDFITANKNAAKSLESLNEAFGSNDFVTLNSLDEKLNGLKDLLKETDVESPMFKQLKKEIADVEAEISRLTGKGKKEIKQYAASTVGYYQALVSAQEKIRDETAKTPEEYKKLQREIDITKSKLEALQGVFDSAELVYTPEKIDLEDLSSAFDDIDNDLEDLQLASDVDKFLNTKGVEFGIASLSEKLKINQEELNEEFEKLYAKDFKNFQEYEKRKLEQAEIIKEQRIDNQLLTLDGIDTLAQSFFELDNKRLEEKQERNQTAYDAITNSATSTEEQKEAAAKKYDQEQKKLDKEKARRQRQLFILQQAIEIARIYIQAAAASAAALAPPPIGLGPILGPGLLPGIQLNAGIATGIVLAQAIPQFFKGKNAGDNFEGVGTWGEKRKEVNVDANGNIEVSPNRTTPRYIKKSDIIVPSIPQFQRELKDPSSDVFKRVSRKMGQDTVERNNMIMVSSPAVDTKGIEEVIYKALSQRQAIKNNVNVTVQAPRRTSY